MALFHFEQKMRVSEMTKNINFNFISWQKIWIFTSNCVYDIDFLRVLTKKTERGNCFVMGNIERDFFVEC